MTGNISYLSNFEKINRRYVAFGGNPKGGKITCKGKIKTGKLDFYDVYFVKELKFNLFSISHMCDKKNSVLFTDTKCIVLSSDFKLPDENHVLLRVPRENNMYNVDLKNIVPSGDLTCPFAKATLDESNLWHRRLGYINFKTMNKLVKGSGPTWLFDIDILTKSMNYQPVILGNQPNPSVGIQEHFDVDKAGEWNVQQYVLFPLWSSGSKYPQNTGANATFEVKEPESEVHVSPSSSAKTKKHDDKTTREAKGKSHIELSTGVRNLSEEFEDFSNNILNEVNAASTPVPAVGQNSTNSTNTFSAAGPSDTVVSLTLRKYSYVDHSQYPDDPNIPALEDITYSDDEEDVGAEADFSNLETNITVSPIPITRVDKDHPVTQIISYLSFAPQTRSMTRMVKEQEPKRVHQALKDPSWIEAMQEELLQFKMQKVWVLVDLLKGVEDSDYPNKVYKVVKALYGLHQAPTAWCLKGKPHLGLWYPKDLAFNLVAYSDSDYAGASLNRKSTTCGYQFLGYRLISWHILIVTMLEQALIVTMLEQALICSCSKLLCSSAINSKSVAKLWTNDIVRLQALIDRRNVIITEDMVRQALRLDDAESIDCLPNEEIFAELARIVLQCMSAKRTA
uniref:Ribonuclease H-like domain-containing protein n=1 Tax=Tanacetum cinerariifolium TaxID=118510 RepID=A0A699IE91_TANCI|nr:ribonuclease H-like domain-containing protein [Tanacetum cinerariifolium]